MISANRLQKQSEKKEENNQSHEAINDIINLVTRSIRSFITVKLGAGFIPGLIAVLVMVAIVGGLIYRNNKKFEAEYRLKKAV